MYIIYIVQFCNFCKNGSLEKQSDKINSNSNPGWIILDFILCQQLHHSKGILHCFAISIASYISLITTGS